MGNISHLLVPTYPTIHLPNSMMRVYPERADATSDQINGLPIVITSHRGASAFQLSPLQAAPGTALPPVTQFTYDNETIHPWYYQVTLDEQQTLVKFAPSHQSAIYEIAFTREMPAYLVLNTRNGTIRVKNNRIYASQKLDDRTTVYLFAETDKTPLASGIISTTGIDEKIKNAEGKNVAVALRFSNQSQTIRMRYGVSFISEAQAEKNLRREIKDFDLAKLASGGRHIWNETLGTINVQGADEDDKYVFYTSLYRCYERPVNISEDGQYFSAYDGKVHTDARPFYTDDWLWDTYRAAHPLRVITHPDTESDILHAFVRMAEQMDSFWFPTFPEITGDSRRMNSNHGVATIADAMAKGVSGFDAKKAYLAAKKAILEKTLAPWSSSPGGWLDSFYHTKGYIPALQPGEKETVAEVHGFEKRQPVAVTLGTAYDEWCLSQIAGRLGLSKDQQLFKAKALNYRNLFNDSTGFFHPKDKEGNFIKPFDYRYSGGQGARMYYGENNGWVYRWDVPHDVQGLIKLMGGRQQFNANLDQTFREPLGKSKFDFYQQLPDHTGNVGQFSMANEPSLHIPYLYNYSGQPWMTQKRIRKLINLWFRNDLMGVPGDEDGGGMSSFVVFSMLGFYPVTPGVPVYNIGSPFFKEAAISLRGNKKFTIKCINYSPQHKYIQSARLNGKQWNKPWFSHADLLAGGTLELTMGLSPNKDWGSAEADAPPSFSFSPKK